MSLEKFPLVRMYLDDINKIDNLETLGIYTALRAVMYDNEIYESDYFLILNKFRIKKKTFMKHLQILVDLNILVRGKG